MRGIVFGLLTVAVTATTAAAQDIGTPRSATYVTKAQIDAVNALPGTDRAIKVVNIGHELGLMPPAERKRLLGEVGRTLLGEDRP